MNFVEEYFVQYFREMNHSDEYIMSLSDEELLMYNPVSEENYRMFLQILKKEYKDAMIFHRQKLEALKRDLDEDVQFKNDHPSSLYVRDEIADDIRLGYIKVSQYSNYIKQVENEYNRKIAFVEEKIASFQSQRR